MQGIFQKENTDKALKYGIYRHLPTYEKIIRNLVSFYFKKFTKKRKCPMIIIIFLLPIFSIQHTKTQHGNLLFTCNIFFCCHLYILITAFYRIYFIITA
ncbi:hypothetical protein DW969_12075 [Eubacterium sp. AM47-9]|nr:hypothetical protein DW969_12075 [Eubacterium sp. AM47-9]